MRLLKLISFLAFALGITFVVISAFRGEISVGFILFFPFIYGEGFYAAIGVILIFISILLFVIGLFNFEKYNVFHIEEKPVGDEKNRQVEGGGILLIGPIPIVIGSNWKIVLILISLAVAIVIITFLLSLNLAFAK